MRFNFDFRAPFVRNGLFQFGGNLMRGAMGHLRVEFEIKADGNFAVHALDGDMVDGKASTRGHQQDAFQHAFIIQGARIGADGQFNLGHFLRNGFENGAFDLRHAFQRHGARHRHGNLADDLRACGSQAQHFNIDNASNGLDALAQTLGHTRGGCIDQRVNRAPPEFPAGNANEQGDTHGGQCIALLEPIGCCHKAHQHERGGNKIG